MQQEESFYEDSNEDQTDESIESNMIMNDDDNSEQNDSLNAVVTNAKIADMDRKRINAMSKIASSFANVTSLLRDLKTNAHKLAQMWGI